jgi:hypothetical protein
MRDFTPHESTHEGEIVDSDALWSSWTPSEVAARLATFTGRWYVVAGWALDLFRGEQTREHDDIEIGVPAKEFAQLRAALFGFDFDVVGSGRRWPLESPAFGAHFQTWVREPQTGEYRLDVFRDPHRGDIWQCRRDLSIERPYEGLILRSDDGIPYMSPEVALLFKAKATREKDWTDFEGVLPLLSVVQRAWLAEYLDLLHPGHPWVGRLATSS